MPSACFSLLINLKLKGALSPLLLHLGGRLEAKACSDPTTIQRWLLGAVHFPSSAKGKMLEGPDGGERDVCAEIFKGAQASQGWASQWVARKTAI